MQYPIPSGSCQVVLIDGNHNEYDVHIPTYGIVTINAYGGSAKVLQFIHKDLPMGVSSIGINFAIKFDREHGESFIADMTAFVPIYGYHVIGNRHIPLFRSEDLEQKEFVEESSDGYGPDGYDFDGYDFDGYDCHGYDCYGYDCDGYSNYCYDCDGYRPADAPADEDEEAVVHADEDEEAVVPADEDEEADAPADDAPASPMLLGQNTHTTGFISSIQNTMMSGMSLVGLIKVPDKYTDIMAQLFGSGAKELLWGDTVANVVSYQNAGLKDLAKEVKEFIQIASPDFDIVIEKGNMPTNTRSTIFVFASYWISRDQAMVIHQLVADYMIAAADSLMETEVQSAAPMWVPPTTPKSSFVYQSPRQLASRKPAYQQASSSKAGQQASSSKAGQQASSSKAGQQASSSNAGQQADNLDTLSMKEFVQQFASAKAPASTSTIPGVKCQRSKSAMKRFKKFKNAEMP